MPQALPFIYAGTAIGSLLLGAAGAVTQYQGQKEQQATAGRVTEFNARLEEEAAIQRDLESQENSRRARTQAKRIISGQRAAFGGSGTLVNTGSPLEVQAESAAMLERSILDQDRAARLEVQRLRSSAQSIRLGGQSLATGLGRQATGTLLGGTANLLGSAASFYRFGNLGIG